MGLTYVSGKYIPVRHIDVDLLRKPFSRFPHLPFSRLHPKNSGYIRTLDYMISQDADVIPRQYSPATAKEYENYYQTELSEMRESPIPKFPAVQSAIGRKYEPKVIIL